MPGLMSVRVNVCGYVNTDADSPPIGTAPAEWIGAGKSDRHGTPDIRKRLSSQRRRAHSRQFQNPTARNVHFDARPMYYFREGLQKDNPHRSPAAQMKAQAPQAPERRGKETPRRMRSRIPHIADSHDYLTRNRIACHDAAGPDEDGATDLFHKYDREYFLRDIHARRGMAATDLRDVEEGRGAR